MNTKRILENLEYLHELVEAHPEELFDLKQISKETDCGTLYCSFGLALTTPYFRRQGIIIANDDELDAMFGPDHWGALFTPRFSGIFDEQILGRERREAKMTDKSLALLRIEHQALAVQGKPALDWSKQS